MPVLPAYVTLNNTVMLNKSNKHPREIGRNQHLLVPFNTLNTKYIDPDDGSTTEPKSEDFPMQVSNGFQKVPPLSMKKVCGSTKRV